MIFSEALDDKCRLLRDDPVFEFCLFFKFWGMEEAEVEEGVERERWRSRLK